VNFLISSFTLFLFYDALHYKLLVTYWRQFLIGWFCRVLDVCCTIDDYPYLFSGDTTSLLSLLMSSLPHLTHLDISGTNLAGWIREQPMSHRPTSHTTNGCVYVSSKLSFWIFTLTVLVNFLFWQCWLGIRKIILSLKKLSDEVLAWLSVSNELQMICIWSSWCHCHPTISCFIKIQIRLTFLVPAYPGCHGKEAAKRVSFCLCLSVCLSVFLSVSRHEKMEKQIGKHCIVLLLSFLSVISEQLKTEVETYFLWRWWIPCVCCCCSTMPLMKSS